jgi:hypothetical protein
MKVRIAYTIDVSDDIRRGINKWYGRPGLASREEIQRWYRSNGDSMDSDLLDGVEDEA